MRIWVWSLALLSGLRIQCCGELWCRLTATTLIQTLAWLRSCIVVAVVQAGSYNSDSNLSLGTSIYHRYSPKKKERKKKKQYYWNCFPSFRTCSQLKINKLGEGSCVAWGRIYTALKMYKRIKYIAEAEKKKNPKTIKGFLMTEEKIFTLQ